MIHSRNNHFTELKNSELFQERMNNLTQAEPYIGKYFSQDYVRREVLHQTDDEILEQDKLIAAEIEAGLYTDPLLMQQMELSAAATEVASQQASLESPEAPAAPTGGEI